MRTVLWVSGCEHKCSECHNKETWDTTSGKCFDDVAKIELMDSLANEYVSGLTLSGGDPMHKLNRQDILNLVKEVKSKYPGKSIWMYTGYTLEEIKNEEVLHYVDVLIDGPFEVQNKTYDLPWVGSSNQRVIFLNNTDKNYMK